MLDFEFKILIDSVKASFKERLNELESLKPSCTWEISRQIVTPDDQEAISKILCDWCDSKEESQTPHIIFTMGGTGFSVNFLFFSVLEILREILGSRCYS
jgi:molybdopterin biosynthesis enzyme MoaB